MTHSDLSNKRERNLDLLPVIDELIGESELIRQVRQEIEIAASLDLNVLVIGEPGTGKELVARGIHDASRRAKKRFVAVNCAAINPYLIESELFGYELEAFIVASAPKRGPFERADGGTLFLDEIGDLSPKAQTILLSALREREIKRIGGTEAIKIDVRLIASTDHDLRREVDEERFRRDLYDRLCEYPIRTPSLRERPTDIPILIRHHFPSVEFEKESLELLCLYPWPGNARQLITTIERLADKAGGGQIITTDHVLLEIALDRKSAPADGHADSFPDLREGETLTEYICRGVLEVYEMERAFLGSHAAAARRMGMNRTTLYDWLEWARRHITK